MEDAQIPPTYNPQDYYDEELKQLLAGIKDGTLEDKMADDAKKVDIKQAQLELILRLDYIRQTQHLSMQELAAKVGIKPESLSRVWSRKTDPKLSTLLKVARALGVRFVVT